MLTSTSNVSQQQQQINDQLQQQQQLNATKIDQSILQQQQKLNTTTSFDTQVSFNYLFLFFF